MNFKQIALIVGAALLLLASLPLIGVGAVGLAGNSMVENATENTLDAAANSGMSDEQLQLLNSAVTGTDGVEGVSIAMLVLGLLALGGGITCAVFASKQKSSA